MSRLIHDKGAHLNNRDAHKLVEQGMKQEDAIREFFEANPGKYFTAWEVYHAFGEEWFIQSVRRSMTNLTEQGILVKCEDIKKPGDGGVECCTWTVNVGQAELFGVKRGRQYGDAR